MKLEIAVAGSIAALLLTGAPSASLAAGGLQALDKGSTGVVKVQLERGGGAAAGGGGGGRSGGGGSGSGGGGFSGGGQPSIQHRGGGGAGAWRGGGSNDSAIVRRDGSRHYRHSDRRGHKHRHRHGHGGVSVYVGPYDYYYYNDYSCEWLRRRAIETGSRYWWRRYRQCIDD